MIRKALNKIVSRGTEVALTVVLVLIFFLLLIGLLVALFPKGTSLGNLIQSGSFAELREQSGRIEMNLLDGEETPVARLSRTNGRVQDKPATEIAWGTSQTGMELLDRHAVQTGGGAGARISYDDKNQINLGENTLVVVRAMEKIRHRNLRRGSVVVLDGELSVSVSGDQANPFEVEVEMTNGVALFEADKPGNKADFEVVVNDDQSSTISVYSGRARIESPTRTIHLESNQAMNVASSGEAGSILQLPPAPTLKNAVAQPLYRYRVQPPRVHFEWDGPGAQDAYLFTLAKDSDFEDVVREKRVSSAGFTHGNLEAGHYYWRVRSLRGGLKSAPSRAGRVRLVSDAEPPVLSVSLTDDEVTSDSLVVKGSVETGAHLFIDDEQVQIDEGGNFEHEIRLERGLNIVVLQAVDPVGNTTYEARRVRARF